MVMADCGSLDDALVAPDAGADLLGTTLAGCTDERPRTDGPLQLHPHVTVLIDQPAASRLQLATYFLDTFQAKPRWQWF